jgi:hypothetical protein
MSESSIANDNSITTVSSYIDKAKSSFTIIKTTSDKQAPIIIKAVENVKIILLCDDLFIIKIQVNYCLDETLRLLLASNARYSDLNMFFSFFLLFLVIS